MMGGKVDLACRNVELSYVCELFLVGGVYMEIPLQQVLDRRRDLPYV